MEKTVVELFAGVGGFRIGLNHIKRENKSYSEENNFEFLWVNQWEPSTKTQEAFDCYKTHFGNEKNELINKGYAFKSCCVLIFFIGKIHNCNIVNFIRRKIRNNYILFWGFVSIFNNINKMASASS